MMNEVCNIGSTAKNDSPTITIPNTTTTTTPTKVPEPQTPTQKFNSPPLSALSSSTNFEEQLQPELVNQGWRKLWSKRENRPYYWNKLTGESLWEHPHATPIGDPLNLGVSSNPPTTPGVKRPADNTNAPAGPPMKKFILNGPWDLEIPTNVTIIERTQSTLLHSHPEIELFRSHCTVKLIKLYEDLCQKRESINAPKDSFHRWLMERKVGIIV